jgi:hypothetical protein
VADEGSRAWVNALNRRAFLDFGAEKRRQRFSSMISASRAPSQTTPAMVVQVNESRS